MMTRRLVLTGGALALTAVWSQRFWGAFAGMGPAVAAGPFDVSLSDGEWHKRLNSSQYAVLRQSGTEQPFTSALLNEHRRGTFTCAGCDQVLFSSETKFDSGTGWPSFWAPLDKAVGQVTDRSFGIQRTAVHCGRCGGHLGDVFNDGPKPTGLRYCMNGVAMGFLPSNV